MSNPVNMSIVKGGLSVPQIEIIGGAIEVFSRACNSYFELKEVKETTKQIQAMIGGEIKKNKLDLEKLKESVKLNIKYLNDQLEDQLDVREKICQSIRQLSISSDKYFDAYILLLESGQISDQGLQHIHECIINISKQITDLTKQIRPTSFATIN
jgi:hypothetical protein